MDSESIASSNLGVGDEVFLTGLFTKVKETTRNIPIVRIGTLAMMPGERIPFKDGRLIDAYLVESRSIGGLSGSPVFIRETVTVNAGTKFKPGFKLNAVNSPNPVEEGIESVRLTGLGKIFFLGSMIGHWDAPTGFPFPEQESVDMGISPVVPAHKIREIITQPELMNMLVRMNEELATKKHADAVEDFDTKKEQPLTKQDFEDALRKVTRKTASPKK